METGSQSHKKFGHDYEFKESLGREFKVVSKPLYDPITGKLEI